MQHCWEILRHHEKWGRSKHGSTSSPATNLGSDGPDDSPIDLSNDGVQRQQTQDERYRRPKYGRSAAKERRKNASENDPIMQEILETSRRSFEQIKEGQSRHNQFWEQRQAKKSERVGWQQQKWEAEIMDKDLTNMTPTRMLYFKNMKMELLENQRVRAVSRSLSFGEGSQTTDNESLNSGRSSYGSYHADVGERSQNLQFDFEGVHNYHQHSSGYQDHQPNNFNAQERTSYEFSEPRNFCMPTRPDGNENADNSMSDQAYEFQTWNRDLNN